LHFKQNLFRLWQEHRRCFHLLDDLIDFCRFSRLSTVLWSPYFFYFSLFLGLSTFLWSSHFFYFSLFLGLSTFLWSSHFFYLCLFLGLSTFLWSSHFFYFGLFFGLSTFLWSLYFFLLSNICFVFDNLRIFSTRILLGVLDFFKVLWFDFYFLILGSISQAIHFQMVTQEFFKANEPIRVIIHFVHREVYFPVYFFRVLVVFSDVIKKRLEHASHFVLFNITATIDINARKNFLRPSFGISSIFVSL